MPSQYPETRYHVILPSPDGSRILVQDTASGVMLLAWHPPGEALWEETSAVNEGVRQVLGATTSVLRALRLDWSDEAKDSYYLTELLDPCWEPPAGSRWIAVDELTQHTWRDPVDLEVLAAWRAEQPAPQRVAWYRPGWFVEAETWIDRALRESQVTQIGEVEQLRSWERSAIMRVDTDSGWYYFKAVPPQWGHEPELTRFLSERFPDVMPEVLKADRDSGRMLVREYSGNPLPKSGDLRAWRQAYAALGRVQRSLAASVQELIDLGVPYRPVESITSELPDILADERRMRLGMDKGLTEHEITVLRDAQPRLEEASIRLASGPIPLSIDHGDFWPGNIFACDERVTLFDWSDATVSHPFFSLVMADDEIGEHLGAVPGAPRAVIDGYLREWIEIAPLDDLRLIFEDAMLVAPLHQAMMYRNVYLPAMEFVDELDRMTPHFLRWLATRVGSL